MISQENGGTFIEGKGAGKLPVICRHKDWWGRPSFPDWTQSVKREV